MVKAGAESSEACHNCTRDRAIYGNPEHRDLQGNQQGNSVA